MFRYNEYANSRIRLWGTEYAADRGKGTKKNMSHIVKIPCQDLKKK